MDLDRKPTIYQTPPNVIAATAPELIDPAKQISNDPERGSILLLEPGTL